MINSMMKFVLLLILLLGIAACNSRPQGLEVPLDGSRAIVDVAALKEGTPGFYWVEIEGKRIGFFIIKVDGKVSSYFNACAKCYPRKLGYRFENGSLVCRACSVRYDVHELNNGIGGCYPLPLKGEMAGRKYVIEEGALLNGVRYF